MSPEQRRRDRRQAIAFRVVSTVLAALFALSAIAGAALTIAGAEHSDGDAVAVGVALACVAGAGAVFFARDVIG